MDTNSKNCFAVGQPIPDVNARIKSMDNQQRFPPINEHQKQNTGSFFRQKPKSHPRTRPVNAKTKNVLKQQQHNLLSLATFNIKGFQSNQNYYNGLLQKFDIFLLQEHWLFNFEQDI